MSRRRIIVSLFVLGFAVIGIVWVVPRSMYLSCFVEIMYPGLIPASSYTRNLDSGDNDLIRESLSRLADRKNPVAIPRALEFLHSTNDYIWLNAAFYTGACGRQEAVPYLIKALRHTAWRADEKTAQYLLVLTGQDFGTNFQRWQQWWVQQHSDTSIDWTSSLGSSPRIPYARKK